MKVVEPQQSHLYWGDFDGYETISYISLYLRMILATSRKSRCQVLYPFSEIRKRPGHQTAILFKESQTIWLQYVKQLFQR